VFFAGIVGVPWQDIARDPVDLSKGFQTSEEMIENGTWSTILGHPSASPPVVPSDPHMIVSTEPRAGIAGPDSPPGADPKNGHEWRVPSDPNYADLQYACIFPLSKPRDCTGTDTDCDCWNGDVTYNPLCQNGSGAYGKIQYGAKAYPGLRELEFLKGVGNQGIVGSICPKNTTDSTQTDYGYRPAIESIIVRLRRALRNQCLPRALEPDEQGSVPCVVVEIWSPPSGETCRCEGNIEYPGRRDLTPDLSNLVAKYDHYGTCRCEIEQLEGSDRSSCLRDAEPSSTITGWCYVDPVQSGDRSQCELVEKCAPTDKRMIRYVGKQPRGAAIIVCQEKAFPTSGGASGQDICQPF